jgi:hypothetical protein
VAKLWLGGVISSSRAYDESPPPTLQLCMLRCGCGADNRKRSCYFHSLVSLPPACPQVHERLGKLSIGFPWTRRILHLPIITSSKGALAFLHPIAALLPARRKDCAMNRQQSLTPRLST